MSDHGIDVRAARVLLETDPRALIVDVRTPAEYESSHIPGAVNLPLEQVDAHLERIVTGAGGRLVLVCRSGRRAGRCRNTLAGAGLDDTVVLEGGMNAWEAQGAPLERGRERWALERQVRLVAGGIVLGSVLASPLWFPAVAVAGVVGAGLVLAAVTDTCAMGMALSRLPCNRPSEEVDIEDSLARIGAGR
ncbi:rhodanese-like domain-containing protein [Nocardiopsis dassonvillei]